MFVGSCGEASTFSTGAASFGGSAASALAANRVKAKAASNVCNVLMRGNRQFVVRGGAPFGNQVVGISAESGKFATGPVSDRGKLTSLRR